MLWTLVRPGYLVALFVAGWAVNVALFAGVGIDYAAALGLAHDQLIRPWGLLGLALLLAAVTGAAHLAAWAQPSVLSFSVVLLLYPCAVALLFLRLPRPLARRMPWRTPLAGALWRCLLPEAGREPAFAQVLVADGLTSLARALQDVALGSCVALAATSLPWSEEQRPLLELEASCRVSPWPALAMALPFLIRARQCFVALKSTQGLVRLLHGLNLGKYLSALPPVLLGVAFARAQGLQAEELEALWGAAALLNAGYCFLWDLSMDWGLLHPAPPLSGRLGLRPVLLLPVPCYHAAACVNAAGRALWVLRWERDLALALGPALSGLQQAAEVCRRCLWSVLRVEWECVKRGTRPTKVAEP